MYNKLNYYFVGRLGFQIKYRGYRIELEGIESYLGKILNAEFILIPHLEISPNNYKEITWISSAISDADRQLAAAYPYPQTDVAR